MKKCGMWSIFLCLILLLSACAGDPVETDSGAVQSISVSAKVREEFEESLAASSEEQEEPAEVVTDSILGEFVYDISNKYQAVGCHDYVFAGKITEIRGAVYPLGMESRILFTDMTVTVTEVIKGDLSVGTQVDIYKQGGYDESEKEYYLYNGDVYPAVGMEYLFLASGEPGSELWVTAPYTTIPLEAYPDMISTYSDTMQHPDRQISLETYMDAYEHEIPYEAETYEVSDFLEPGFIGGE